MTDWDKCQCPFCVNLRVEKAEAIYTFGRLACCGNECDDCSKVEA